MRPGSRRSRSPIDAQDHLLSHSEDSAMTHRSRFALFECLAGAPLAAAQPTFGNPSPTAGRETSQKANAAADQTIYQPVVYTNANKKGPAVVVIPARSDSAAPCRARPST